MTRVAFLNGKPGVLRGETLRLCLREGEKCSRCGVETVISTGSRAVLTIPSGVSADGDLQVGQPDSPSSIPVLIDSSHIYRILSQSRTVFRVSRQLARTERGALLLSRLEAG